MIKQYALGCAFSLDELLYNFPYHKLDITCSECYKIIGDQHRNILIKKVFRESLKLVIEDIINNNVTFWLPLVGGKKCNIHMLMYKGESFKHLRQAGKWRDIDILKSNFVGYQMSFFMLGNRTPRIKSIYLNKQYRDKIIENTNNGKQYGDGKIDTTIKDYYDKIYSIFPDISKKDINLILNYAWRSLYLHNSYGGDTLITDKEIWFYVGNLRKEPLRHFYYYIRKTTVKLRVLYKRTQQQWDGYYYFALTNKQYEDYLSQKKKRGRPRKNFTFKNILLYQILDECKINEHSKQYIFRISYISNLKFRYFIRDICTSNAELIIERKPLKFEDILKQNNKYEFI